MDTQENMVPQTPSHLIPQQTDVLVLSVPEAEGYSSGQKDADGPNNQLMNDIVQEI